MTTEEIMEAAREAEIQPRRFGTDRVVIGFNGCVLEQLQRFAAIIEAKTLERAAVVCEKSDRYRGDYFSEKIRQLKEK